MRLTKERAAQNRGEILDTATQLFKTQGIDSVSVADLMKAAGFTHGGFYNHFESKAELAVEAIRYAFEQSLTELEARVIGSETPFAAMADALAYYVAPEHRDEAAGGCPTGSLPVDVGRQAPDAQAAFADGLEKYIDLVSRYGGSNGSVDRECGIGILSTVVGAIILSRAVRRGRPDLSDEILAAARATRAPIALDRPQPADSKRRTKSSA